MHRNILSGHTEPAALTSESCYALHVQSIVEVGAVFETHWWVFTGEGTTKS